MRTLTLSLASILLATCAGTDSATLVSGPVTSVAGEGTTHDADTRRTTTTAPTTTHTHPTTTAPPATTPPTTAPIVARTVECGGWGSLMAEHFGNAARAACSVASCESQFNPNAVNASSGASGLLQVMPFWADEYQRVTGVPYYDGRFDGPANIRFAAWLFHQSGTWSHWVCKP